MRVTHFAHSDAGSGASANALRLHRGLLERGVGSRLWVAQKHSAVRDVFQLRDSSFVRRRLRELEPWLEARVLERLVPRGERPLSSGLLGHDPVPIVEADQADVVQLHWLGLATLLFARLARLERPIVWRLADMWALCGVEHLCGDPRRFLVGESAESGAVPAVDRFVELRKQRIYATIRDLTVVCPSRWMADLVRRSRLLQGRPVEVIPTGCDTDVFRPIDRRTCRELLRLPQDRPLVLAGATNLSAAHKGFDLFVSAANRLHETHEDACVVLFGPSSSELAQALRPRVFDRGSIADRLHLALLYAACDVFVAPSRIENLANTVLEAMACGTPCVAFSIGGMPDMIDHRQTGFLAPPFETDELAAGIAWAIEYGQQPELRARCRATIESRFSLGAQAAAFLALYQRIAGAGAVA